MSNNYTDLLNELKNNSDNFNKDYQELINSYLLKNKGINNATNLNNPLNLNQDEGKLVTPEPVCLFKTFDENNEKIFINIASDNVVSAPKEENILEMNNQYGIRVPMSLSEKAEDFDNSGNICGVYDVIFNPKVTDNAMKDPELMRFVINLIVERINQRFKHKLNINKFKFLKNIKYKGKNVRSQMVKIVKNKVEEVMNSSRSCITNEQFNFKNDNNNQLEVNKEQTPEFELFVYLNYCFNKNCLDLENEVVAESIKFIENSKLKSVDTNLLINNLNYEFCSNIEIKELDIVNNYNDNKHVDKNCLIIPLNCLNIKNSNTIYFILKVSMPLITKSIGIKVNVYDKNKIEVKVNRIYKLELEMFFLKDIKNIYNYFISDLRILYLFIENTDYTDSKDSIYNSKLLNNEAKSISIDEEINNDLICELVV